MEPVDPPFSIWDYECITLTLISNFHWLENLTWLMSGDTLYSSVPLPWHFSGFLGLSLKSVHQSWAMLPHWPAMPSTDSLQPNLDNSEFVLLRQDLTFCHFVAAAVVIRNDWETHLCYFWEGSCQGILLHAMTYMLPGQARLSDHLLTVLGAFLFLLPMILGPSCCLWLMHSLPSLWSGHSWGLACLSSNLTPVRVKKSETSVWDVVLLNIEAEKNFSYLGCLLFTT